MDKSKKHHYLSQFYLEHFSKSGRLFIYDRIKNEYREGTPLGTAYQKHFYTVEKESGVKDTSIEEWLSGIEGKAQRSIVKIVARKELSDEDEEFLAHFAALMVTRTPSFDKGARKFMQPLVKSAVQQAATLENMRLLVEETISKAGTPTTTTAENLLDVVTGGNFEVSLNRNMPLKYMVDLAADCAAALRTMNWLFVHASEDSVFVTCDDPFSIIPNDGSVPKRGVGIATHGVIKFLPLTRSVGMLILNQGAARQHVWATSNEVEKFNVQTAMRTDRLVISSNRAVLEALVSKTSLYSSHKVDNFGPR